MPRYKYTALAEGGEEIKGEVESISEADIAELNIPTGVPRRYEFDASMKVTDVAYLGDQDAIAAAAAAVANQSK